MSAEKLESLYPDDEPGRIAFWKRQIEYAKNFFEPYFRVGDQLTNLYNNRATTDRERWADSLFPSSEGRIKANLIFAWTDQSIANMTDRNPLFNITPKNRFATDGAPVVKAVSNYWYQETGQLKQDRRCLLDAHLQPFAIKKVGWTTEFKDDGLSLASTSDIVQDDPYAENELIAQGNPTRVTQHQEHDDHIKAHRELLKEIGEDSPIAQGILIPHIQRHEQGLGLGTYPDVHSSIKYDAPFGIRWKPRDFLCDPDSMDDVEDARWIAFRVRAPLYTVKADPNFINTEELQNANLPERPISAPAIDGSPLAFDDFGMVEYWEIWARDFPVEKGKRKNLLICLVEGYEHLIRDDERWPYENIETYPVVLMNFQTDVNAWINLPTLALAGGNNIQRLMNEFMDSMLSVVRKQKNVFLYDPAYFSREDIQNILNQPDGSVYPVSDLVSAGDNAIVALPFQHISEEKGQLLSLIQQMFDRTAGTPQPIRNPGDETATEVAVNDRKNTSREDMRGNLFKEFQVKTVEMFWMLHTEFRPSMEFLIDVRAGQWSNVNESVAKGQYRFRVEISSRAQSKAVERNDLLQLFNLCVGVTPTFISLQIPPPNLQEILRLVLERGFDIMDVETILPGAQTDLAAMLEDPEQRMLVMQSLSMLRGGGDSVAGQGPGPIDAQQFARNPTTAAKQEGEAQRLEG